MVGTLRFAHPSKKFCVSLSAQTKRGGIHAQRRKWRRAPRAARGEEEMVGPQEGRQILSPQDRQVEGTRICRKRPKPARQARPKQRIAISHHREEDFKADGLRAYAHYRGSRHRGRHPRPGAGACDPLAGALQPAEVSKLHYHDVEFQMVYVLKGWVKTTWKARARR
jgi:hypothetical protein